MQLGHRKIPVRLLTLMLVGVFYVLGSLIWIYLRDYSALVATKNTSLPSKNLSEYYSEYQKMTEDTGAKEALMKLKNSLSQDLGLAKNCHGIAHQIGQTAFVKYNSSFSEAAVFQDSVCNSGYIHGVIESAFKDTKDITTSMNTVCAGEMKDIYTKWECFHGIGHGVMYYTGNNLPISIQYCETLKTDFERSNCENGVYMENFNAEASLHPSQFVKNDNYFFPCDDDKLPNRDACYYYAPIRFLDNHQHDYTAALNWCLGAGNFKESCQSGVIGQVVKDDFMNLKLVEPLCSAKQMDQKACIESALVMVSNMSGNTRDADTFCNGLLDASIRKDCLDQLPFVMEQFKDTKTGNVRISN